MLRSQHACQHDGALLTACSCARAGCVGFETRKVMKHHAAPAAAGTAATMPGSQPAQGHHTGVGAAISNLVHPHGTGAATQARKASHLMLLASPAALVCLRTGGGK